MGFGMFFLIYPLANVCMTMENRHAINGKTHCKIMAFPIAMVILHSYVKLLEGSGRSFFRKYDSDEPHNWILAWAILISQAMLRIFFASFKGSHGKLPV